MKDELYMNLALKEAKKGTFSTSPNPRVGCILVKNDHVISSGYHEMTGKAHAEIMAINNLQNNNKDLTAYVTLEPCSHHGLTPPCCQALIALGISRAVIAMRDPNPLVAGKGIKELLKAGIEVLVGLCEQDARILNRGYIKRMQGQGPWLKSNIVIKANKQITQVDSDSNLLGDELAHHNLMEIRASSCAILTDINTIDANDLLLNVKMSKYNSPLKQPDLLILDPGFHLRYDAKILTTLAERKILILTRKRNAHLQKKSILQQCGCEVILLPENGNELSQSALQHWLINTHYNEVLIECGLGTMAYFFCEGLLDELTVYQNSEKFDSSTLSLIQTHFPGNKNDNPLQVWSNERVGKVLKTQYLFTRSGSPYTKIM